MCCRGLRKKATGKRFLKWLRFFFGQNHYQERSRYEKNSTDQEECKVKKAEGAVVKTLSEYGALGIDAEVAVMQQMIPWVLMHALGRR